MAGNANAALEELNHVLRGRREITSFSTIEGRLPGPFRYVITLDSDTLLPRSAAKRLVAKLAHPLNQARFEPGTTRVARGYSILQPRVTPSLPLQEDTSFFQSVYTTKQGLDPYAFTISDVYQDLFDEGSFAGKGIYDLDALTRALSDRIPENAVLSHDLLEGNYARSGLVTDVAIVEQHPTSYEVASSRTHRWTRGDWQLLPWILGRHDGLSALGVWKMLDNLRRSLAPVLLVSGMLVALAVLPVRAALVWFLLVGASFFLPPLLQFAPAVLLRRKGVTQRSQFLALGGDVFRGRHSSVSSRRRYTPPNPTRAIRAYPPGVRENGGQYTHGAVWSVFAWAKLGREDRAAATFQRLNPVTHALTPQATEQYRVEPYAVAADIYAVEPYVGRGGWTWYTGAAGWMYRAGLEAILGIKREGATLRIEPCLPPEWDEADVSYRFGDSTYEITIAADCPNPRRVARVLVDGVAVAAAQVDLHDDGAVHQVRVELETQPG
ncbi:MAG: hypothetical protein IPL43_13020 [Micropruina sp.]|nr:hypothetical protein [Micropruina sp.]